jgi:hypothetical protein
MKMGVHGDLSEKISDLRVINSQGPESVPKVVECKQCFGTGLARLIVGMNKRPPQFDGIRDIFLDEAVGEIKQL